MGLGSMSNFLPDEMQKNISTFSEKLWKNFSNLCGRVKGFHYETILCSSLLYIYFEMLSSSKQSKSEVNLRTSQHSVPEPTQDQSDVW